jgi:hypothetical protein
MSNRKWWRKLFIDHPGFSSRPPLPEALYDPTAKSPKAKVACLQCWTMRLATERAKDEAELREGKRTAVRDKDSVQSFCEQCFVLMNSSLMINSVGNVSG